MSSAQEEVLAPSNELVRRVSERKDDPSDATPEVVQRQLAFDVEPISWVDIDTGGTAEATITSARSALGI